MAASAAHGSPSQLLAPITKLQARLGAKFKAIKDLQVVRGRGAGGGAGTCSAVRAAALVPGRSVSASHHGIAPVGRAGRQP